MIEIYTGTPLWGLNPMSPPETGDLLTTKNGKRKFKSRCQETNPVSEKKTESVPCQSLGVEPMPPLVKRIPG